VVVVPGLRAVTRRGVAGILVMTVLGLVAACGEDSARTGTAADGIPSSTGSPPAPSGPTVSGQPLPSESRSPAELLQLARAAFLTAPSVHVTGTAVRGADAYVVDARLTGASGGTATVKTSGETVQVVRVGDVAYVGGDLAFWQSVTGDAARARALVGSSVRTGADEPNFASYVAFTRPETYAAVLPDPAQPATLGATTVIRGMPAIAVRDQAGSTLYVARTGPAYPLRLDGLTNGQVVFLDLADYGAPVTLGTPPPARVREPGGGS
jgi:hypothetical protein